MNESWFFSMPKNSFYPQACIISVERPQTNKLLGYYLTDKWVQVNWERGEGEIRCAIETACNMLSEAKASDHIDPNKPDLRPIIFLNAPSEVEAILPALMKEYMESKGSLILSLKST